MRYDKAIVMVQQTRRQQDKAGNDYIAYLKRGGQYGIDVKARQVRCSQYWQNRNDPELPLEIYSMYPNEPGWTVDSSKQTDYVLFKFHPDDTQERYVIPFHQLRVATIRNWNEWRKQYPHFSVMTKGYYETWETKGIFVPVSVVQEALKNTMKVG